jgi:hypothetical protein
MNVIKPAGIVTTGWSALLFPKLIMMVVYVYGSVTARVTSTQQMAYGTITDYIKIGASFKYATLQKPQLFLLLKSGTICFK